MPAARRRIVVCLLAALAVSAVGACQAGTTAPGPSIVQPGAPGRSSQVVPATPASPTTHTDADVHFMQGMIGHHAQALDMTALLYTRSRRR